MTMILGASQLIDNLLLEQHKGDQERIFEYSEKAIANLLVHELLSEGYIKFRKQDFPGDENRYSGRTQYIGELGVASHDEVADLKRQLKKAHDEGAKKAIDLLCGHVATWGSFYGHAMIEKNKVYDFSNQVLKEIER